MTIDTKHGRELEAVALVDRVNALLRVYNAEIQHALASVRLLGDERDTLREENERLREALRWYANEIRYNHPCDPSCCEHLDAQIVADEGARARAALKGG